VPETAHPRDPLATYVGREQWAETIPPEAHRLVADINAAFEQQILKVPQR
jgi:hypothetical protein